MRTESRYYTHRLLIHKVVVGQSGRRGWPKHTLQRGWACLLGDRCPDEALGRRWNL